MEILQKLIDICQAYKAGNFGVDEYVGTYKAEYDNYTGTETVFGGTALHRKNGDHIKLTIKIEKMCNCGKNSKSLVITEDHKILSIKNRISASFN